MFVWLVAAAVTMAATGGVGTRGTVAAAVTMAATGSSTSHGAAAASPSYRLADTWRNESEPLTAGRFRHVADVSSAPDGTVFVLDSEQRAVHVLSSAWAPVGVFEVPSVAAAPTECRPARLDAGADGRVAILGTCSVPRDGAAAGSSGTGYVLHMRTDGSVSETTLLSSTYSDIAVRSDGTLVLARMWPVAPPTPVPNEEEVAYPGGLDIVDASGHVVARIEHESLFYPIGVDVGGDDSLYVANRVPSPWDYEEPGPQPTPLPALLGAAQESDAVDGVVVFEPNGRHRQTVPFVGPEDVAVGPSGAFVSRNVEIFRIGEREPLYSGPPGQLVTSFSDPSILHLDVSANGRLLAGMAHCYFQGLLVFDRGVTAAAVPRPVGSLDQPELRGPTHPARIAAGERVSLLQDRFLFEDEGLARNYFAGPNPDQPQTVQIWSSDGRLVEQKGVCSGSTSVWLHDKGTALWTADVAADGDAVYTLDRDLLKRRVGPLPEWSLWPGAQAPDGTLSHLTAASADAGHVAVLDVGTGSVVVVRQDGSVRYRWPLAPDGADALPGDIALAGDSVYIADTAQGRVRRYALEGTPTGTWQTHDRPWRIDAGSNGDVFVLTRSGWAMRYDADGALLAAWPMPIREARAVDVAAGPDGRVYVAYVVSKTVHPSGWLESRVELQDAGIWVFEPTTGPDDPRPQPGACWTSAARSVEPTSVRSGDQVTVSMAVAGACPGTAVPAQVVLVLDTSRSMNWDQAVDRAKQLSLAVLGAMDPRAIEVALVTFDDEGILRVPLTKAYGDIATRIAATEAWGDSRLAAGLARAFAELQGERAAPGAHRAVIVVTDGEHTDDAREMAETLRAAGIDVLAVVLPHGGPEGYLEGLMVVTGDRARVLVDPDPETANRLARTLAGYREEPELFRGVEIVDRIPRNMRYVTGSAVPPPQVAGDTLRWSLGSVPASEGLEIRYRLEPLQLGQWPTSDGAVVDYLDALGKPGRRSLPIPQVYVWDASLLTVQTYLPYAAQRAPTRREVVVDGHAVQRAPTRREVVVDGHAVQRAPTRREVVVDGHGASAADRLRSYPDEDAAAVVYLPVVASPPAVQQFESDLHAARARYPNINGSRLNHCRLCHVMDERFGMNSYGLDYLRHDRDFAAIEPIDSDGDGFSNLVEIEALTFPGWAGSRPTSAK